MKKETEGPLSGSYKTETKKFRVRNSLTWDPAKDLFMEKPTGVSLTVPDQSLTIRQIIDRYNRGLPLSNRRDVIDLGPNSQDITWRDPKSMDYTEIQEEQDAIKARLRNKRDEANKKIQDEKDKNQTGPKDQVEE